MEIKRLGKLFRHNRLKRQILQKDAAKMIGVSSAQLSKIETLKHAPNGDLALNMIEFLIPDIKNDILLMEIEAEQQVEVNRELTGY